MASFVDSTTMVTGVSGLGSAPVLVQGNSSARSHFRSPLDVTPSSWASCAAVTMSVIAE
jgi:hypothetical protein